MKILIAGNESLSVEIAKLAPLEVGCEVFTSPNGSEAFEIMANKSPDLVFANLDMPSLEGDELCKKIKEKPDFKDVPVVILSPSGKNGAVSRCQDAGCDDILPLPYTKADLIRLVEKYVNIICRRHARHPVSLNVSYSVDGKTSSGRVLDVSEGGMFMRGDKSLPIGADTQFTVLPNDGSDKVGVKGEVVAHVKSKKRFSFDKSHGMGVRFHAFPPELKALVTGEKE